MRRVHRGGGCRRKPLTAKEKKGNLKDLLK
jgi:hypothetical protein